jgi:ferric-dicitrate binding protein FerR (iron transport regulator)
MTPTRDHSHDRTGPEDLPRRLAGLAEVPLDAPVRASLRRAFQDGTLAEVGAPRRARWFTVGAAAAAILLFLWVQHLGPGLRWNVLESPDTLTVDGVVYGTTDALDRAVARGGVVEVPDAGSSLVLGMESSVVFELTPGSVLEVPSPTAGDEPLHLAVRQGELRALTGPAFAGRRLAVTTPDGRVEVTGTIFSVACDAGGTCVCVLEGRLRVGVDEADLETIPAGRRKVLYRDGRTAEVSEAAPPHVAGLEDFRAAWAGFVLAPPHP